MSEYEERNPDEEPDQQEFEADPSVVAFLDQQEAEFEQDRENFRNQYGFDHQCTCSQDYSSGKVGEVTECFMSLAMDALGRCAEATHEINMSRTLLEEMLKINDDLVKMLEDAGKTAELEAYFKEEVTPEASEAVKELKDDVSEENGESEADITI